jgi:hypothetical protein
MLQSPSLLKQVLLDTDCGNGIAPTAGETLIAHGWAEWVDHEHSTPIDENSPRSVLRLTQAGREQLNALAASVQSP